MRYTGFCALLVVLILLLDCSAPKSYAMTEYYQTEETMDMIEAELLAERLGIDDDCAEGLADELENVGARGIDSVEVLPSRYGYHALVTDCAGSRYYVMLGEMGYLELVRRDSRDGEVLYAAID